MPKVTWELVELQRRAQHDGYERQRRAPADKWPSRPLGSAGYLHQSGSEDTQAEIGEPAGRELFKVLHGESGDALPIGPVRVHPQHHERRQHCQYVRDDRQAKQLLPAALTRRSDGTVQRHSEDGVAHPAEDECADGPACRIGTRSILRIGRRPRKRLDHDLTRRRPRLQHEGS